MDQLQLSKEDISFVHELVREGGRIAVDMREGVGIHQKSGPSDLVTDADLAISKHFVAGLRERFPDDVIVSEEDKHEHKEGQQTKHKRVWLIDPIDGTVHYVNNDGNYSSMIGFVLHGKPVHGWIYQPSTDSMFFGGPDVGAWKQTGEHKAKEYRETKPLAPNQKVRLMLGWADRKRQPWLERMEEIELIPSRSLGLNIMKILADEADVFVSLIGRVKLWDTAAPAAIALGGNLDVATMEGGPLPYPVPEIQHGSSVVIGRPGTLAWAQKHLSEKTTGATNGNPR